MNSRSLAKWMCNFFRVNNEPTLIDNISPGLDCILSGKMSDLEVEYATRRFVEMRFMEYLPCTYNSKESMILSVTNTVKRQIFLKSLPSAWGLPPVPELPKVTPVVSKFRNNIICTSVDTRGLQFSESTRSTNPLVTDILYDSVISQTVILRRSPPKMFTFDIKKGMNDFSRRRVVENEDEVVENEDEVVENEDEVVENEDEDIETEKESELNGIGTDKKPLSRETVKLVYSVITENSERIYINASLIADRENKTEIEVYLELILKGLRQERTMTNKIDMMILREEYVRILTSQGIVIDNTIMRRVVDFTG